ncbi:mitochondrial fission process protein 1 [Pitangus sulphuratus]|nr:mitochondrial fission process protein 1 [Pitangus sulphuratus]
MRDEVVLGTLRKRLTGGAALYYASDKCTHHSLRKKQWTPYPLTTRQKEVTLEMKCLYTNARSRGNKQKELEICVQPQGFDLMIGMLSCLLNMLFRRQRAGVHSAGVALYVQQHLECIKLCPGVDDEQVESLWVWIKEQISKGDTVVGVRYRMPDQEKRVYEAFYRQQLEAAFKSQALFLVGNFNYPDNCWRNNTAKYKQSRRFL